MSSSRRCRIAVIVRAHVPSSKLDDLLASLAGHARFDTYVMANESRGPLPLGPYAKIPTTLDTARDLGFDPASDSDIVYCSDLLFEHLRRCLPHYDFYTLIEFDVGLTRKGGAFIDDLAHKLASDARDLDMVGTMVSPCGKGWAHYPKAARLFPAVHMVFFPLVVLSPRAILHLYRRRLAEGPRSMPMQERVFCEAFVGSALVCDPGFRCADLNDLFPGCYQRRAFYWGLPMLHGGATPHDTQVEISHPVYSGPDFLGVHLENAVWTHTLPNYRAMLDEPLISLPESLLQDFREKADRLLSEAAAPAGLRTAAHGDAARPCPPVVFLVDDADLPIREATNVKPQPMTVIGEEPLIAHTLASLISKGCNDFIVPLGPEASAAADYLRSWNGPKPKENDGSTSSGFGRMRIIEAGPDAGTGMRIKAAAKGLNGRFLLVFGHIMSDIDLQALLALHERSGKLATVTAVQPAGIAVALDGDLPVFLDRHPYLGLLWTDAGCTVCEPGVLDVIQDRDLVANGDLLARLEAVGQLAIFDYKGFWQGADTAREIDLLRRLVRVHSALGADEAITEGPQVAVV